MPTPSKYDWGLAVLEKPPKEEEEPQQPAVQPPPELQEPEPQEDRPLGGLGSLGIVPAYEALVGAAKKELAKPEPLDKFKNAGNAYVRGLTEGVAAIPQGVAIAANELEELAAQFHLPADADKEVKDYATYQWGEAMKAFARKHFPQNEELQKSFLAETVPGAFGSMTAFMLGGAVTKLLGGFEAAAVAGMGAAMEGGSGYEQAKAAGATEEDAQSAALWQSLGGLTEAVPVMRIFGRFDKASGGQLGKGLKSLIKEGAYGTIEEAAQEFFQTMWGNKVAKDIYDKDRKLLEDVWQSAGAGGIVGAVTNGVMIALGLRRRGRRAGPPSEETFAELSRAKLLETDGVRQFAERNPLQAKDLAEQLGIPSRNDVAGTPASVLTSKPDRAKFQSLLRDHLYGKPEITAAPLGVTPTMPPQDLAAREQKQPRARYTFGDEDELADRDIESVEDQYHRRIREGATAKEIAEEFPAVNLRPEDAVAELSRRGVPLPYALYLARQRRNTRLEKAIETAMPSVPPNLGVIQDTSYNEREKWETAYDDIAIRILPESQKGAVVNGTEYVFHAVPKIMADRVRKEGIAPGSFFALTPDEAAPFAKDRPTDQIGKDYVIFAVPRSDIALSEAEQGDEFGKSWIENGLAVRSKKSHKPAFEVTPQQERELVRPAFTRPAFPQQKGVSSAQGIREDAGQVQEGGLVGRGGQTQGGPNLQLPPQEGPEAGRQEALGIPVASASPIKRGDTTVYHGIVAADKPVVAYRGIDSFQELEEFLKAGQPYWFSRGMRTVELERGPTQGSTMFSADVDSILAVPGKRPHGKEYIAVIEADISGLPFRTLKKPDGYNIKADAGLGLGVEGPIPIARIRGLYNIGESGLESNIWPDIASRYNVSQTAQPPTPPVLPPDAQEAADVTPPPPQLEQGAGPPPTTPPGDTRDKADVDNLRKALEALYGIVEDGPLDSDLEPPTPTPDMLDTWMGDRDVDEQAAHVLADTHQRQIKAAIEEEGATLAARVKEWATRKKGKYADLLIQLNIDLRDKRSEIDKWWDQITPEQQQIVTDSQNLPPALLAIADAIIAENEAAGLQRKKDGLIANVIENYLARIWKPPPGRKGESLFGKYKTKTARAKPRVWGSILEGWANGAELAVEGATLAQQVANVELARVKADRALMKAGIKAGVISDNEKQIPDAVELEHPNMRRWMFAGSIPIDPDAPVQIGSWVRPSDRENLGKVIGIDEDTDEAEVHFRNRETGREATVVFPLDELQHNVVLPRDENFMIDEDGTVLARRKLYATPELGHKLNKILGTSTLYRVPGVASVTFANSAIKQNILLTALFHPIAFLRSSMFGSQSMNPIQSWLSGRDALRNFTPAVQDLVRGGLTIGRMQDWEQAYQLQESTVAKTIDAVLGKDTRRSKFKETALEIFRRQQRWVFSTVGAPLKVQAALLEYYSLLKRNAKQLEAGTVKKHDLAKIAAGFANDDFGGLHLARMGRNPSHQHIGRLLLLAPDWTESNINTMWKAFKKGEEGHVYRMFWARIVLRALGATMLFNFIMAGLDADEFWKELEASWKEGKLRWMDVNVTPLYRQLGGTNEKRKWLSLIGHFHDPFKFLTQPVAKSIQHKGSVLARMATDAVTASDWAGRRFTTIAELIGQDEKGVYKTTRPGKYEAGEPKGGKLAGTLVTWQPGEKNSRYITWRNFPSFAAYQARQSLPIPIQSMIEYMLGEQDAFDLITRSAGIMTATTYEHDPRKAIREHTDVGDSQRAQMAFGRMVEAEGEEAGAEYKQRLVESASESGKVKAKAGESDKGRAAREQFANDDIAQAVRTMRALGISEEEAKRLLIASWIRKYKSVRNKNGSFKPAFRSRMARLVARYRETEQ